MKYLILALAILLPLASSVTYEYCSCEQIQSQSQCENIDTYQGICFWNNGACRELACLQRLENQLQCEADYGNFWCAWKNDSSCINPTSCGDLYIQYWCERSGCLWIPGEPGKSTTEYQGSCTGTLNSITCMNLSPTLCEDYYFYNYKQNTYELCSLNTANQQCFSVKECGLFTDKANCNALYCMWDNTQQSCQVQQCENLKTQDQCNYFVNDIQTYTMCTWDSKNNLCKSTSCNLIKDQGLCTHRTAGYGSFCNWEDGECTEYDCADATNSDDCLHSAMAFSDGGFGTCTWVPDLNTATGYCYPCSSNGPVYIGYEKSSQIILAAYFIVLSLLSS